MEADQEARAERGRWKKAREYNSTLDNNRNRGMTSNCYKSIGLVVFDETGEFIDWI